MTRAISRRGFVQAFTACALSAGYAERLLAHAAYQPYHPHLGFQAFTVRDALERDPRGTLKRLAAVGYREVELSEIGQAAVFAPIARDHGLRLVGSHIPSLFSNESAWAKWAAAGQPAIPAGYDLEGIVAIAQRHGLRYLGYPSTAPREAWESVENFGKFCDLLDRVGARCRKAGIVFAYHNHHREFGSLDGKTYLDRLAERAHPENVAFEIDVCWVTHGGQDPVAVLSRLKGRVPLIHLKDRKPNVPTSTGEDWPEGNIFAEVGSGTLDVAAILHTARESGVAHVFVEQDETDGDAVDSLAKSYAFVKSHKL